MVVALNSESCLSSSERTPEIFRPQRDLNPKLGDTRAVLNQLGYLAYSGLEPVSRKSLELFGPEKPVVKLQSSYFEKLIFEHVLNVRKTKKIAQSLMA